MNELKKLTEIIEKATRQAAKDSAEETKAVLHEKHRFNSVTDHSKSMSERIAETLLANHVIVVDKETALAMCAGAQHLERDELFGMGSYVHLKLLRKGEISFEKAAEILESIGESAINDIVKSQSDTSKNE